LPPTVQTPVIDENLGISILSFTRRSVAYGNAILITDRPDLNAILGHPSRDKTIADGLGTLLREVARPTPVPLGVGTTDHHDRQIGPGAEPASLMLNQTSRSPAQSRAVFREENAIADIDQESLPVLRDALRLVGFDRGAIIRIAIATIECGERAFRPQSFCRPGVIADDPR
jgi:hypothetical protein